MSLVLLYFFYEGWLKNSYPTSNLVKKVTRVKNKISENKELIKDKKFISKNLKNNDLLILDARSKNRFLGKEKEIRPNLYSGNIPGSINVPYTSLSKNGEFLNYEDLKKIFNKKILIKKKKYYLHLWVWNYCM